MRLCKLLQLEIAEFQAAGKVTRDTIQTEYGFTRFGLISAKRIQETANRIKQ